MMRSSLPAVVSTLAALAAAAAFRGDVTLGAQAPAQQTQPPDNGQSPQPPSGQPAQPTFRAGINFVRVDVIVADKNGRAVVDLQPGDFEVTEDGKRQAIETFKLVTLDGGRSPGPEPPRPILSDNDEELEAARDDVRLFAIFLDDYHVRRNASVSVREPLTRFIEREIGPSDMVGVMYPLEPMADVRLGRDHEAIIRAVQEFVGRKFDYTPRNAIEENYAHYPANTVEQIRNEVSLSALKSLVTHMGSLKEGRKGVILVSEGFTALLPPQLRDPVATAPGLANPDHYNPDAGLNNPYEQSANFFASLDLETELKEVYDAANRNNTAIYAVDPRGLAVSEFDIEENINIRTDQAYLTSTMNTLRELSEQTDGRAIVNRNDLDTGMKQITRDSSAYYLLGYNSTETTPDGKFHAIKVRVKRAGVDVRGRKGYWALNAEEAATSKPSRQPAVAPAIEAALSSVAQPARARLIRTWIGTSRGDNGRTRVTFVWEPVTPSPGEREETRADQPARVALIAAGSDGGAPYFRGRVPDAVLAAVPPASSGAQSDAAPGAPDRRAGNGGPASPRGGSQVVFEARPGPLQLRVSVEGASSEVLDTETREVAVPDLTGPQIALSTPALFRARTAREFQQLSADVNAVPAIVREFSRTDRLFIRFAAYGPGSVPPTATARLLNRAGQKMADFPVKDGGAPMTGAYQVDLPLASLPVGEYLIEVKAAGETGEAKELVGFRVTG